MNHKKANLLKFYLCQYSNAKKIKVNDIKNYNNKEKLKNAYKDLMNGYLYNKLYYFCRQF